MTLFFEASCVHSSPAANPFLSLGPSLPFDTSRAFQRAVKSQPGSRALEQERIDYLLERVSKSPYNFIRNRSRYTGKRTQVHLRWKYFRNQWRVKTAEEFINQVATASKRSGLPYLVEFPDKSRYPLHPILLRELGLFDQALETEKKLMAEESKSSNNANA